MARVAVLVGRVGLPSEIFIRRHIECLSNDVVVIAGRKPLRGAMTWGQELPSVTLPEVTPAVRAWRRVKRLVGDEAFRQDRSTRRQREALRVALEAHGVELVLVEYLDQWITYLKAMVGMGLRVYGHGHGYDVSRRLRDPHWVRAYLQWNEAAGVLVPSSRMRDRLLGLGLEEAKIHVVPYGVEIPEQPNQRSTDRGCRYLAVGRMVAKKAPLLTLEAFRLALQDIPGLRLDMIGDGPMLESARQYVHRRGLAECVTFWGAQPHTTVRKLLKEADVFLQHSVTDVETGNEEGLPVSILEAMAHGLPVVATRHAGIPEAVVDGETGYLVDEGDAEGMSQRMVALARSSVDVDRLGRAGRERASRFFSIERQCQDLRHVLSGS